MAGSVRLVACLVLVAVAATSAQEKVAASSPSKKLQTLNQLDKAIRAKRSECEAQVDSEAVCVGTYVQRENCILRCISEGCYTAVYGADALEDGEVDIVRGRQFRACSKNEVRVQRTAQYEREKAALATAGVEANAASIANQEAAIAPEAVAVA
ncbi:hypothetical protein WJX72_009603 [[Myrmecia] bisecta]|uniref:Uncharacterized protein n=1 Tax=[Myrmecia] bisecta TaxID=41462 RepID=A0AAW1R8J6_9CHLO